MTFHPFTLDVELPLPRTKSEVRRACRLKVVAVAVVVIISTIVAVSVVAFGGKSCRRLWIEQALVALSKNKILEDKPNELSQILKGNPEANEEVKYAMRDLKYAEDLRSLIKAYFRTEGPEAYKKIATESDLAHFRTFAPEAFKKLEDEAQIRNRIFCTQVPSCNLNVLSEHWLQSAEGRVDAQDWALERAASITKESSGCGQLLELWQARLDIPYFSEEYLKILNGKVDELEASLKSIGAGKTASGNGV